MRILYVSPELAPLSGVGGLGEVAAAFPRELAAQGMDVRIIVPATDDLCRHTRLAGPKIPLGTFFGEEMFLLPVIPKKGKNMPVEVRRPFYLFICGDKFGRKGTIYADEQRKPFKDNSRRFAAFSYGVSVAGCLGLQDEGAGLWIPDVVHLNDWTCALASVFAFKDVCKGKNVPKFLLTIHNLAHQGPADAFFWEEMNLGREITMLAGTFKTVANPGSFLALGIFFSHMVSTVSPHYAKECLTIQKGYGLQSLLKRRKQEGLFYGILNGIDSQVWNPQRDPYIPARYSGYDLSGKAVCKKELQKQAALYEDANVPLFVMVSRLERQKGFDVLLEVFEKSWKNFGAQLIILGVGEASYEDRLHALSKQFYKSVKFYNVYDGILAHRVMACGDIFLMPSVFEPCGLGQMYAQHYGTLPLVHPVGGLRDTVLGLQYDRKLKTRVRSNGGDGFIVPKLTPRHLYRSLQAALNIYRNEPLLFLHGLQTAMHKSYGWGNSVTRYRRLYQQMVAGEDARRWQRAR